MQITPPLIHLTLIPTAAPLTPVPYPCPSIHHPILGQQGGSDKYMYCQWRARLAHITIRPPAAKPDKSLLHRSLAAIATSDPSIPNCRCVSGPCAVSLRMACSASVTDNSRLHILWRNADYCSSCCLRHPALDFQHARRAIGVACQEGL